MVLTLVLSISGVKHKLLLDVLQSAVAEQQDWHILVVSLIHWLLALVKGPCGRERFAGLTTCTQQAIGRISTQVVALPHKCPGRCNKSQHFAVM